jgi:hypothetical protein
MRNAVAARLRDLAVACSGVMGSKDGAAETYLHFLEPFSPPANLV